MANISKEIFNKYVCKETPCSIIHVWAGDCMEAIYIFGINSFMGCLKFFAPIYAVKLLLNWKRANQKYLANESKAFLRSTFYGTTYAMIFLVSLCAFSHTIGFRYYNILCAGFFCGLSILIEAPQNRILDTMMLFNQVVEGVVNLVRHQKNRKRLQWTETLVFMSVSSILMYLFKTQDLPPKFEHLWFYPGGSLFDKSNNYWNSSRKYSKSGKLWLTHTLKEAFKYFCMGYILEIIKKILSRFHLLATPKYLFSILFNKENVLFGLFMGGYTFLYRCISYYLFKRYGGEFPIHSLMAGFMAGASYRLRPNIQIPVIGFTTILQLLWQRLRNKFSIPSKFPYYVLVCCISTSFLMHFRFHLDDYCPKYSRNMINIVTNNLATKSYDHFWWIIEEISKHEVS